MPVYKNYVIKWLNDTLLSLD